MPKCLMVLGASFDQIPMIETARAMGLEVIALDANDNAPGFNLAHETHCVDVMDSERALEIAKRKNIRGITTMVSNLGMRTVAYVAENLGLQAISTRAAGKATDKKTIKEALIKGGIPVPQGNSCSGLAEARAALQGLALPVVVKPIDGTKGRGISMVSRKGELEAAVSHGLRYSPSKRLIIEEWISGPTVGAECVIDGDLIPILLTDKFNTPPPKCVTIGLTTPSQLPDGVRARVRETARAVAKALDLTTGAAHIDMVVDGDVPNVIDVGPRLASGPVIFDFAPKLMGVNMIKAVIQMAIGERPDIYKDWNGRFAASRFISAPERGCMYGITFPSMPKDFSFYPHKLLGHPVAPPISDVDRLGCVTIFGDSYEDTIKEADDLLSKIQVNVAI